MSVKQYASVWDAVEGSPAQAENMKLRSTLMRAIIAWIEDEDLTQAEAARLMAVTQPRISDLVRGKIDLFSIDMLVNMLSAAGLHVEVHIAQAD